MFWRFGLNPSAIDGLLDKEDLTLQELLEEDDLLQECKTQNNKLIDYLRRPNILSQLLQYIIQEDLDDRQRFKYPYVACEVLSCEIWAICEAVIDNPDLLASFWQLLDRPPPLNPLQASYFVKVNAVFLSRKTSEMVKFIRSIPKVVNKLLTHMETSAIMDLLLKLISVEEYPEGAGVVDWLNSEGLIQSLISKLDPNLDPDIHSTAAQVLNDIISISQSSNPEQGGVGPNALSRELISEKIVSRLVDYMLDVKSSGSTSTLINGVGIFIQIIQKNNWSVTHSLVLEEIIFTLKLILLSSNFSDYNEEAMLSLVQHNQHNSVVDLSEMLRVLANRIGEFKKLLESPKSVTKPIETTIGKMVPLGFERFRICELFAELIHCSNMSLMNTIRPESSSNGLFGIQNSNNNYSDYEHADSTFVSVVPEQEQKGYSSSLDSINSTKSTTQQETNSDLPGNSIDSTLPMDTVENEHGQTINNSVESNKNSNQLATQNQNNIPVGDLLKEKFIEHKIIPTCLDLFFTFKWNNFLHTVVYDMIAQIFNRRMDIGRNKELAISVFTDGKLTKRITEAQKTNEKKVKEPKGVRLGYMGHLTFIAEEVVKLLDRYAVDIEYIEAPEWQEYVSKTLRETRERDRAPLGGQRPNEHDLSPSHEESEDEEDDSIEPTAVPDNGDIASHQFARYLCQQITNHDKFNSSDEDEDEDDSWMGDDFNPNVNDRDFENRQSSLDDDYGDDSDEEEAPSKWSPTLANFSSNFGNDISTNEQHKTTEVSMAAVEMSPYILINNTPVTATTTTTNHHHITTSATTTTPDETVKSNNAAFSNATNPAIPNSLKTTPSTASPPPIVKISTSSSYTGGCRSPSDVINDDEEEEEKEEDRILPIGQESPIMENNSIATSRGSEDKLMDFSTFDKMGIKVENNGDDGFSEKI
ncbi:6534_t:CDS:10 [Ambispora leptoticha]|uniref:6534_t:CDS:1 n=1 Tax=Ambispora leptoticha TaxID=144679 RepID=A0A9N8YP13_9GLOM|nr:6534_t:CDS:10 [Ambispora leptoticha]